LSESSSPGFLSLLIQSFIDEHLPDDPQNRLPVPYAHSDQSRKAGEARIAKHLGQDTLNKVLNGDLQAQLVNVWRPLRGPVKGTPLAMADSRTVSPGGEGKEPDWRESELKRKDGSGEILMVSRLISSVSKQHRVLREITSSFESNQRSAG